MTIGTEYQLSHAERVAYIQLCGWHACWNYGLPMFTDGEVAMLVSMTRQSRYTVGPDCTEYKLIREHGLAEKGTGSWHEHQNGDPCADLWNESARVGNFYDYLVARNG
jgi:hypothetical protein